MINFLQEYAGQIIGYMFGAGGVFAYIFERRKNTAVTKGVEADASSKEIDNSSKVIDLYKNALDDLEKRYENKFQEIISLYDRKIRVLEDEIRLHKRLNSALKRESTEYKKRLKEIEDSSK